MTETILHYKGLKLATLDLKLITNAIYYETMNVQYYNTNTNHCEIITYTIYGSIYVTIIIVIV